MKDAEANEQHKTSHKLAEKAQDIEVTIKKSQEKRYNLDPGSFFVNRFWIGDRMGSQSMKL